MIYGLKVFKNWYTLRFLQIVAIWLIRQVIKNMAKPMYSFKTIYSGQQKE